MPRVMSPIWYPSGPEVRPAHSFHVILSDSLAAPGIARGAKLNFSPLTAALTASMTSSTGAWSPISSSRKEYATVPSWQRTYRPPAMKPSPFMFLPNFFSSTAANAFLARDFEKGFNIIATKAATPLIGVCAVPPPSAKKNACCSSRSTSSDQYPARKSATSWSRSSLTKATTREAPAAFISGICSDASRASLRQSFQPGRRMAYTTAGPSSSKLRAGKASPDPAGSGTNIASSGGSRGCAMTVTSELLSKLVLET
mmetsp:Transcript_160162/g.292465  ORF Transcript_160162/g.292465 Transcript_160162/m.292465 type:complete len:256 (-) Transcript_160162:2-769(-)